MPQQTHDMQQLISSIFSDETPLFRTPAEPEVGDTVSIRLRILKNAEAQVTFLTGMPTRVSDMRRIKTDAVFDWYETEYTVKDESPVFYPLLMAWKGKYIH